MPYCLRFMSMSLLLLALSACSALVSKVKMDAGAAATEATAAGHPERAVCYNAIGKLAFAPSGLLSKFETVVEGRELVDGPCAPIFAGVALHLIDKVPFTP